MQNQIPDVEDTFLPRRFGLFEFIRKVREDQLSVLSPDLFDRRLGSFRMFRVQYFFVNWPSYIEHVLLDNHQNYIKGRFSDTMLGPIVGTGMLTSEGEAWRRRRRIAAPAFHHRSIARFVEQMGRCTATMLDRWEGRDEPFDIASEMTELTLDVITRTMFSTDVSGGVSRLKQLMQTVLRLDRPSMTDMLGLPRWIPRSGAKGLQRAITELDGMVQHVLTLRRRGEGEPDDLLSLLLAARDEETGEGLTDRQLRDEIMTIFLAGHETTANVLAFVWHMLTMHPEVEARVQDELAQVLGGRVPAYADIPRLRYTRMVFEETLRLYPPAYALSRTALGPDVIGGVTVPKGAVISIYPYIIHRNPVLWDDPDRFDPERFAPDRVVGRERFAFMPFGGGPRICIGQGFAMAEALVVMVSVLQRFRLSAVPGRVVEPIGLLTLRPKNGVWVTAAARQGVGRKRVAASL
jgi:cytochrome P450